MRACTTFFVCIHGNGVQAQASVRPLEPPPSPLPVPPMPQSHARIPPVLDLFELALALGFGGALVYDYARDSSRRENATYLFDYWWLNMIFLLLILLSNVIRETVRLIWKFRLGYWTKIYWTRGCLIIALGSVLGM